MDKKNSQKGGIFELNTPYDLFCKAKHDLEVFCKNNNIYSLFNLLYTLNHLRNWIHPDGEKTYKNKDSSKRTTEEIFHLELYNDPDYDIIRKLCNNAKHFDDEGILKDCKYFDGLRAGFSRFGDRVGQRYYTVNGERIQDIASRVYKKYKEYFEKLGYT